MGNQFAPCPNCQSSNAQKVGYSMWGGVLGPKILNHVKCTSCKTTYNGKTGNSNMKGIIIYTVVLMGIALTLGILSVSL